LPGALFVPASVVKQSHKIMDIKEIAASLCCLKKKKIICGGYDSLDSQARLSYSSLNENNFLNRWKMSINRYFKINRKDIATVQFIIEGYEGMATVTTIDSHEAIIQISILHDFISEIVNVLEDIKEKYQLEEINIEQ
jgi:hypothetical protein